MNEQEADKLACYIINWLNRRNGGELQEAFNKMRVGDYVLLKEELIEILVHQGKPPNWVG